MRPATILLTLGVLILSCGDCEAGGFFRRVPEVGEWARYHVWRWGDPIDTPPVRSGELLVTFKCVGEEDVDNRRHLWLEVRWANHRSFDGIISFLKILVPEDEIVDGDIARSIVRGWTWTDTGYVRELDLEPQTLLQDVVIRVLFSKYEVTGITEEQRSFRIDDDRFEVAGEVATLPTYEFDESEADRVRYTGKKAIWWPSDEHAFGVVAASQTWREFQKIREFGRTIDWQLLVRYSFVLAETGTDAVSEFPAPHEIDPGELTHGGGLIRRLPDVGEFAMFKVFTPWQLWPELLHADEGEEGSEEWNESWAERLFSTLLLTCIADEELDGIRTRLVHVQIGEMSQLVRPLRYSFVARLRIDEAGSCEVTEIILPPHDHRDEAFYELFISLVFSSPQEPVAGEQDRSLTVLKPEGVVRYPSSYHGEAFNTHAVFSELFRNVQGEERAVTETESGLRRDIEYKAGGITRTLKVEGVWWLNDDLAFGVPACELHLDLFTPLQPELPAELQDGIDIRVELVAHGTVDEQSIRMIRHDVMGDTAEIDAPLDPVSDLPDHN